MADVTLSVNGVEQTIARLNKLTTLDFLRAPMEASVIEIETYMKKYPPPPAGIQGTASNPVRFTTKAGAKVDFMARRRGRYVRTGKLGQSWTWKIDSSADEIVGRVGTNLEYAPWVQKSDQQAAVHQGRWRTDAQAIEQFRDKIVARFRAALEGALK